MATVEFHTRPSWKLEDDTYGDLHIDGEDYGWTTLRSAQEAAADHGVPLVTITGEDAVVSHPRREQS